MRDFFFICQNLYLFFRNILSKFRNNKLTEAVNVVNVTEVKKLPVRQRRLPNHLKDYVL